MNTPENTPESVTKLLDEFFSPASSEEPQVPQVIAAAGGAGTAPKRSMPPPPPSARGVTPMAPMRQVSAPPARGAGTMPPPPSMRRPGAAPPPPPSMRMKAPPPAPVPPTREGHAFAQTMKGVAPPPPIRDSSPQLRDSSPPAPLAAAFGKTMLGVAPPPSSHSPGTLDALAEKVASPLIEPEDTTEESVDLDMSDSSPSAFSEMLGNRKEAPAESGEVSTGVVAAEGAAPRPGSVHDVPTDPGLDLSVSPPSALLPDEAGWGAPPSLAPPDVSAPSVEAVAAAPSAEAAPSAAVPSGTDGDDDAPTTERRPSYDALVAAAQAASPVPGEDDESTSHRADDDDDLPLPGPAAELAASDVEFTRPLPPELAIQPYDNDNELTRPAHPVSETAGASPIVPARTLALPRPSPPPPPERAPVPVVVAFPPPRAAEVDHAPSVQIAGDSTTETTVPRAPFAVSATLPRIPPPAPVPADFENTLRRSRPATESIAPATGTIAPLAARALSNRTFVYAAAAVIGLGALALILRPSTGSVVVTVGGPGGAAVQGVSVKVDGTEKCSSTPCEIKDLEPGSHVFTASASDISGSTEQTFAIVRGEHLAHHIALEGKPTRAAEPEGKVAEAKPSEEAKPAEEAKPSEEAKAEEPAKLAAAAPEKADEPEETAPAKKPSKAVSDDDKPSKVAKASVNTRPAAVAQKPSPAVAETSSKKVASADAPAPAKAAAAGGATLDLTSTPRAAVVVNGRPVGMTPLKGVHVTPGRQTIVFVHPDLGRKVASANLAPGARTSVGVKF